MWYLPLKHLSPPTELHSATNHTTTIWIFTTVKTSNLKKYSYLYLKANFEDWCTNRRASFLSMQCQFFVTKQNNKTCNSNVHNMWTNNIKTCVWSILEKQLLNYKNLHQNILVFKELKRSNSDVTEKKYWHRVQIAPS